MTITTPLIGKLGPLVFTVVLVSQLGSFQKWKDFSSFDQVKKVVLNETSTYTANHSAAPTPPSSPLPREKKQDLHHTDYNILDLQEWEIQTLEKPYVDSCNPPDGKDRMCCLGTPGHALNEAKKPFDEYRAKCNHLTADDYNLQKEIAREALLEMNNFFL